MKTNRDEKGKCQGFGECLKSSDNTQCNQCIKSADIRTKITCKEKHVSYTLVNDVDPKEFVKNYTIDGAVIDGGIRKCDGMFYVPKLKKVLLIELKGNQFEHAVTQLLSTFDILKDELSGKQVYSRIVSSNVPQIRVPSSNMKQLISVTKRYSGTYKNFSSSGTCEEKLSQLDNT